MGLSDIGIILGNDRDVGEERIIVSSEVLVGQTPPLKTKRWSVKRAKVSAGDEGFWRWLLARVVGVRKGVGTFGKSRLWAQEF